MELGRKFRINLARPVKRSRISPCNQHWVLGCLAVLHSALVLAVMLMRPWPVPPWWFDPLWVGIATLWFLWPIVLLWQAGRSVRRVTIPLLVASLLAALWWRTYSFDGAAGFRLPMGCTLSPVTMTRFFAAYRAKGLPLLPGHPLGIGNSPCLSARYLPKPRP